MSKRWFFLVNHNFESLIGNNNSFNCLENALKTVRKMFFCLEFQNLFCSKRVKTGPSKTQNLCFIFRFVSKFYHFFDTFLEASNFECFFLPHFPYEHGNCNLFLVLPGISVNIVHIKPVNFSITHAAFLTHVQVI